MQTVSFDLLNLLKRVKEDRYQIPQFQRPFIWKESQVKLLIDSIARNYPIGSLLVLNKNDEIKLQSRSIAATIKYDEFSDQIQIPEEGTNNEIQYVLDGQQRITSITRVFLDSSDSKTYYFDLKKMLENFEGEESDWVISRAKNNRSAKERISNNRQLRSDIALDQVKSDIYISEYIEDSDDFVHLEKIERRRNSAKIKGYFEAIRKYQVPVTILESSNGLESICRVFETINSTGTRLTTYDLAVARFYPDPDLHQMYKESVDTHSILSEFDVEGERILQVLYLVNAHEEGKFPEPSRSALLSIHPETIKKNWLRAASGLAKAYEWAKTNGVRPETVFGTGVLVSLAGFLIVRPNAQSDLSLNLNSILKRWFYARMLAQGSRFAGNYRLATDFLNLIDFADRKTQLEINIVNINPDLIIKTTRFSDNRYKAILCLMAMNAREDLITGNSLDDDIQYHHIFPRALAKSSGIKAHKLESVANRIAVSRKTNSKLSDQHPSKYMHSLVKRSIEDGTIDDVESRLADLSMPRGITSEHYGLQYTSENIDIFLQNRAEIIMQRIRALLGTYVVEGEAGEEDE